MKYRITEHVFEGYSKFSAQVKRRFFWISMDDNGITGRKCSWYAREMAEEAIECHKARRLKRLIYHKIR